MKTVKLLFCVIVWLVASESLYAQPVTPTLLSPPNGAIGQSLNPTLTWSVSTGATRYHLQLSPDSTFANTIVNDSLITTTSRQVGSLASRTTYYWRVRAKSGSGQSPFSNRFRFTTAGPPKPPQNLQADPGDHEVTLTWTPNTEPDFSHYKIYRGTTTLLDTVQGISNTRRTITNLTNGTPYTFTLTAVNTAGQESDFSDAVTTTPSLFTDIGAPLVGVSSSAVAWGDYDNDGDLDILLTGGRISKVYRNDNGRFMDIAAPLVGVFSGLDGTAQWGDYDNDSDLDILLVGSSDTGDIAKVYRNDNGNFVDIHAALGNVSLSDGTWGDFDNDGDLDILFAGNLSQAKVYRNEEGNFVDIGAKLMSSVFGSAAWTDYDNDGDLDIFLTGSDSCRIYRNDNGKFLVVGASLPGVERSSVGFGDYDNDGDLDILLTGLDNSYIARSKVYRNDSERYVDIFANLTGVQEGSAAWGDYDNDGDLDILLTGGTTTLYRNDGGSFAVEDIQPQLTIVQQSSVAWGDYDNDGDLDILLTGHSNIGISKIYRNNIRTANTIPTAPTGLTASVTGSSVTLNWNKSTDSRTVQEALTYNLRIGSTSDGVQIVSPHAEVADGFRKIPQLGNTNHRNTWTIKNLPDGTYYWSVQAIDNTFAGSNFAAEQSFVIEASSDETPPAPPQGLQANAGDDRITITWAANLESDLLRYRIYRSTKSPASTKIASVPAGTTTYIDFDVVHDTTYFYRITAVDQSLNEGGFSNEASTIPTGPFTVLPNNLASLTGVAYGSVAWGDYDNDNDLDILLTGSLGGVYVTKVYRNDLNRSGGFVEISTPSLVGVLEGSAAWGDYDNDGDLDILLTGFGISKVYQNIGNESFVDISASLTGVSRSSAAWGDYDNDGDLDILLAGISSSGSVSKVYRNDAEKFEDISAALTGVYYSSVAWGDYDNDGDLDILLTGVSSSGAISQIYRNDAGSFVDISAGLVAVNGGSVAWGDYDNDGDLDILLTGYATSGRVSKIYRNDNGSFVDFSASLIGVSDGTAVWGDYDNDGYLDILLTGDTGSSRVTKIYRNDGQNLAEVPTLLSGVMNSAVAWGDYDKDGDLDILLSGGMSPGGARIAKLYRNNINKKNTVPNAPTNLTSSVNGNTVTIIWDKATDGQTAQNALTYNLRIGSVSGGVQKVTPMADTSGYRRVPMLGNTNHRNSWTIKNFAAGTYFWSVQTIDNAFAGSRFAAEKTFTVGPVTNNPPIVRNPILAQTLRVGDASFRRDLKAEPAVFFDPDNDMMTYTASSNATNIAAATITGSELTVVPLATGMAGITVTASDGRGGSVAMPFNVTVLSKPQVVIPNTSSKAGDTLQIPIRIIDATQIAGVEIKVTFDSSILTALQVDTAALTSGFALLDSISPGKITLVSARATGIAGGSGDLVKLTFEVNPTAQPGDTTTLTFAKLALADDSAKAIPATSRNGLFTVAGKRPDTLITVTPDTAFVKQNGTQKFIATGRDTLGNSVAINPSWRLSANLGTITPTRNDTVVFTASATAFGEGSVIAQEGSHTGAAYIFVGILGDINADTTVDVRDVIICLRAIAKLPLPTKPAGHVTPTRYEEWAADVSENDTLDVNDALLILYKALGRLLSKASLIASHHEAIVRIPKIIASVNDIVTVPIFVEQRNDVHAASLELSYDPSILNLLGIEPGASKSLMAENSQETGKIKLAMINADGIVGSSGTMVKLKFKLEKVLESGIALSIESVKLFDAQAKAIQVQIVTGEVVEIALPQSYNLFQNYPNPFNPETVIRFQLPQESQVELSIYNISGQLLRTLVNTQMPAGDWTKTWDGKDEFGNEVPSGVYFYRLRVNNNEWISTKKMILMR